jgi:hypothetical protein
MVCFNQTNAGGGALSIEAREGSMARTNERAALPFSPPEVLEVLQKCRNSDKWIPEELQKKVAMHLFSTPTPFVCSLCLGRNGSSSSYKATRN